MFLKTRTLIQIKVEQKRRGGFRNGLFRPFPFMNLTYVREIFLSKSVSIKK